MTWNDVIAISAILVFLGKLTDWGLRKARKQKILEGLSSAESKLKSLPFRHWETKVAGGVTSAYDYLRLLAVGEREASILQGYFKPVVVLLFIGVITELTIEANNLNPYGATAPYFVCAMSGLLFSFLGRFSNKLKTFLSIVFRLLFISSIFSSIALLVGSNLSDITTESYWFFADDDRDAVDKSALLTVLNFPFDIITILISIYLLKLIIEKETSVALVAPLDILVSLTLSILLHASITYFSISELPDIFVAISESISWMYLVLSDFSSLTADQKMLVPLILTTCIPVIMYMSTLLFISCVIKPLSIVSGYLCGLLGEKSNTPFFELATLISMFIGALKALEEWGRISNYLSG